MDIEKEMNEMKAQMEARLEDLKAKAKEVGDKVQGEVEEMKSRIPWKGMLIFLGVATLAALAFKGLFL